MRPSYQVVTNRSLSKMDDQTTLMGYSPKATFVMILGMHRSGTSCLAGSLEQCGLYLGKVSRYNRNNVRGNHELRHGSLLNEKILIANGGSWDKPPTRIEVNWWQRWAQILLARRLSVKVPCGLKDPRLVLLLDSWLTTVKFFTLVGTFRHPAAVAQSLARRNQMSIEHAYELWLHYNAALIRWHRRYHFPLIEFNLSDIEAYRRDVAALAITLGLNASRFQSQPFVTAGLDHAPYPAEPVPEICRATYDYLRRHRYTIDQPVRIKEDG